MIKKNDVAELKRKIAWLEKMNLALIKSLCKLDNEWLFKLEKILDGDKRCIVKRQSKK